MVQLCQDPSRPHWGHAEAGEALRFFSFYPPLAENVITKMQAEDDAEAARYRRLGVAEVGV